MEFAEMLGFARNDPPTKRVRVFVRLLPASAEVTVFRARNSEKGGCRAVRVPA
ncbi:hypothetical protein [Methanoculleus taiwanensis]|uniref:hypothetical protein n=1 Tax=Methanoculleus taiwanensis TaxID=1550565 RepID=UPI0013E8F44B|nr:hypothetical protein [Methanoculleus taiwanensis]